MRLTLRTLLAYLDDLLKPVEAKEMGKRLADSEAASGMAAKIKDVLRRRRIEAPSVDGDPDPNTVAEYLDNVLPDELVESYERQCLSSDESLAETAACHQILALVMGKPVAVSDGLKERAYGLVESTPEASPSHHEEAIDPLAPPPRAHAAATSTEPAVPQRNGAVTRPVGKTVSTQASSEIPQLLNEESSSSWKRWTGGGVLALAGAALFAVVYSSDDTFSNAGGDLIVEAEPAEVASLGVASAGVGEGEQGDAAARPKGDASDVVTVEPVETGEPAAAIAVASTTDEAAESGDGVAGASRPAEDAIAKSGPSLAPMAEGPVDASPAAGVEDPTPGVDLKPMAETNTAGTGAAEPAVVAAIPPVVKPVEPPSLPPFAWQQSGDGLALHVDSDLGGWTTLPPRAMLFADERVVVPEPFVCTLKIDEGPILFRMLSNTDVRILGPTETSRGGLDIHRGQIVISSEMLGPDAASAAPTVITLMVGGQSELVSVGPGSVFAVNVQTEVPNRVSPATPGVVTAELIVTKGDVRIGDLSQVVAVPVAETDALPGLETMPARSIAWTDGFPNTNLEATPAWMIDTEPTTLERRYGKMYRNMLPDGRPLETDLTAILKEPTFRMSELAALTLTLIEKPDGLVEALGSVHEETRQQAIGGIRLWLAEHPERLGDLPTWLSSNYRADDVETLVRLVVGYNVDDLRRPSVSETLLNDLDDPNIAVRELAIYHMSRLTGRTFDYQPNANQAARGVAARRWRDYVAKQGALLTPVLQDEPEALPE